MWFVVLRDVVAPSPTGFTVNNIVGRGACSRRYDVKVTFTSLRTVEDAGPYKNKFSSCCVFEI